MNKKKLLGVVLILAGIILPVSTLHISSEYYRGDSLFWNIIRNVVTGQIILRDSVFEVVPDRDEDLYRQFHEYRMKHPEYGELPEGEVIEKFYRERYRDRMSGMEFRLKIQKKKIITYKDKVTVSYRYVFILGVVLIVAGTTLLTLLKIRGRRRKG